MVGTYINQKRVSRQLQVLFSLAIYSGMRKGEILALKWPDIDFTTRYGKHHQGGDHGGR